MSETITPSNEQQVGNWPAPEGMLVHAEAPVLSEQGIQTAFLESLHYAEDHNNDPSGIYAEVHQAGDVVIPLLEIGPSKGFVDETSGHTLAAIYQDSLASENGFHRLEALQSAGLTDLLTQSGVGKNLEAPVARGRISHDAHGTIFFDVQPQRLQNRGQAPKGKELERLVVDLAKTGITTRLIEDEQAKIIGYHESGQLGSVRSEVYAVPPNPEQLTTGEVDHLMVLTEVISTPSTKLAEDQVGTYVDTVQDIELVWAETYAKSHESVYQAAHLEPNAYVPITIGGDQIYIQGKYDTPDDRSRVLITYLAPEDVVHKHGADLDALQQAIARDMYGEFGTETVIEAYQHDSMDKNREPIVFVD